jgi:hypothetical protein
MSAYWNTILGDFEPEDYVTATTKLYETVDKGPIAPSSSDQNLGNLMDA